MDELLTIEEVARYCRVHKATIRRHIAAGRLRAVRIGRGLRVRKEDFDAYSHHTAPGRDPDLEALEAAKPFSMNDPFWDFVGKFDTPGSEWVSSDKRRAIAEALLAEVDLSPR